MAKEELTYWDHLEELRRRIIFYLFVLVFFSIVSFLFLEKILLLLKKPLDEYGINLNYFKPYEKLFVHIKLSFFSGLILSFPFLVIQIVSFVLPALRRGEKKLFLLFCLGSFFLLIGGNIFAYVGILPVALRFFINFSKNDTFGMLWGVSSYIDFVAGLALSISLVFQLPLVLLFLLKAKIINLSMLIKSRKYIILLIALFSALFSPPDIVSMFLIGIPLYLLFEFTVFLGGLFFSKKTSKEECNG